MLAGFYVQGERPGILGGLAQRPQDSVRATIEALGQSHAQRLAAISVFVLPIQAPLIRKKPIRKTLHSFGGSPPIVALPAKNSLMLTMCLHELATNAAKYGALSNGTGRVHVGWDLLANGSERKVKLSWRETGGPPVAAPQRKGFGSVLIEQSFGGCGETCFDFRADGLRCSLELSLC